MNKEELVEFLKNNLKIKTSVNDCWGTSEICVSLYLGEEMLDNDCFSIPNLIITHEDFNKISPGRTIVDSETNKGIKRMLVKFLMRNTENFDGCWMYCTEDLTNPYLHEVREDDWIVYANHAEVVDMRTIK